MVSGKLWHARRRAVVPATLVLLVAVVVLSALSLLALDRISKSNRTVATSSRVLASYQALQRAIAAEAFAEAGYRRAPTVAARARLLSSFAEVDRATKAVAASGIGTDRAAAIYLQSLNTRYTAQVSEAVDRGQAGPTTSTDDRVAGPALDAMQSLVDVAIRRTSAESADAVHQQAHLTAHLRWLVPTVLTGVVAALALAWALVLRQHRKATALAARSEHLALHDALTGANNRRAFERALASELRLEPPDATVCLLDLDGFKGINDTHGHDVGDEVLRVVARRLQAAVRPADMVARLGGDEFALLLHNAGDREAVVTRIRDAVIAPLHVGTLRLHPGVSVGTAELWAGATEQEVLRQADRQLYERKRARQRGPRTVPFAG
jgi:diguanylate cyclase (GGDEF)-like protein